MSKQWVQHISGQGEKLLIRNDDIDYWTLDALAQDGFAFRLPKSEYHLCPAPEVWKDVTDDTKITSVAMYNRAGGKEEWHGLFHGCSNVMWPGNGYRLRKVVTNTGPQGEPPYKWAFIVEKKVTE